MRFKRPSGISPGFPELSQSYRQVTHVLLTRPPLTHASRAVTREQSWRRAANGWVMLRNLPS